MATLVITALINTAVSYALQRLFARSNEAQPLSNLKLQTSQFGQMIPEHFGINRIPCIVDYTTDLKPHKHKDKKSGQVSYTYSATFSTKICANGEGGPVGGVSRIWADQTLIYDTTGATPNLPVLPITIYLGDDAQDVDPTLEAILGVGNVSANRGYCYIVWNDWDLTNHGNRIPSLNAEVFTVGGPIPWRVSTFTTGLTNGDAAFYYFNNAIYIVTWLRIAGQVHFYFEQYDIHGTQIGTTVETVVPYNSTVAGSVRNLVSWLVLGPGPADYQWWNCDIHPQSPSIGAVYPGQVMSTNPAIYPFQLNGNLNVFQNDRIYYVDDNHTTTVMGYLGAAGGVPLDDYGFVYFTYDLHYASSNVAIGSSNTGHVYTMVGSLHACKLWKLDANLNVVHFWDVAATTGTRLSAWQTNFYVHDNLIVFSYHQAPGQDYVALVKINGDLTLEDFGATLVHGGGKPPIVQLGDGLLGIDNVGVFSLAPPVAPISLDRIVAAISRKCDVTPYDVTALAPYPVDGYTVTQQRAGRDAIAPLQSNWFFDGVESGGVMKFVVRGGPVMLTIPDDDLAAQVAGSQPPPLATVKRMQEVDLPANVNVTFSDVNAEYQSGTQYARRLVTQSQLTVDMRLDIVMSITKAAGTATTALYMAWLERDLITFLIARPYWTLEPTDVFTAHGYTVRVIAKHEVAAGVIQLDCVIASTNVWIQGPAPGDGIVSPPTTPPPLLPTIALLLDIPLVVDLDHDYGYYWPAGPSGTTQWQGAQLFRSLDGGINFAFVDMTKTETTMGTANAVLAPFYGGNTVDEINTIDVTIGPGGGTLASTDYAGLLNSQNPALLGNEIFQYRSAIEGAPGVWTLSGLLRGRRGTEFAMFTHAAGERFVVLPTTDEDGTLAQLGVPLVYKTVTNGDNINNATAITFTNNGAGARCYSPVNVAGAPIDPFDGTVQINWQRRTRKGGSWQNLVDVPLSEATEAYVVQIWDATFTQCARIIQVTSPTATYTAAQQTTDFGATQLNVYATVGQLGAYGLGIQTAATIPSLGAADTAVIAPIPPYGYTPPAGGGGGGGGGCTLTPINTTITWASSPYNVFAPGLGPTTVWVMRVDTPATAAGGSILGKLAAAEYGGPPALRSMTLSVTPCGPPLGGLSGSSAGGTAPLILFAMVNNPDPGNIPTLAPSTTYYFNITSTVPSGMVATLFPPT